VDNEPVPAGEYIVGNLENYLHEAALANEPPSGTFYDLEGDGTRLPSLGVLNYLVLKTVRSAPNQNYPSIEDSKDLHDLSNILYHPF